MLCANVTWAGQPRQCCHTANRLVFFLGLDALLSSAPNPPPKAIIYPGPLSAHNISFGIVMSPCRLQRPKAQYKIPTWTPRLGFFLDEHGDCVTMTMHPLRVAFQRGVCSEDANASRKKTTMRYRSPNLFGPSCSSFTHQLALNAFVLLHRSLR
ncbi:hypothetical protein LY76DRAFT_164686 [Colletotrichum caudatum]|nr:hypothetical protein LY76DRAFT_164686 [Colletotrichum caudatum]